MIDLKRELLELLVEEAQGANDELPRLAVDSRPARILASCEQERMWFLSQLGEQSNAKAAALYLMPAAFRIRGELEIESLRRAWTTQVERHKALRTALVMDDEMLCQVGFAHVELPWRVLDMSACTDTQYQIPDIVPAEEAPEPLPTAA